MMLEKLCLLLLFFQGQIIFKDLGITAITIYTLEGSTLMLTFTRMSSSITCEFAPKSDMYHKVRPDSMAIQVINVTKSDTGRYQLCDQYLDIYAFASKVKKKTCFIDLSFVLNYKTDLYLCHNGDNVDFLRRKNFQKVRNLTLHLEVNSSCTNSRWCGLSYFFTTVLLKVANLWFSNRTNIDSIVGHEGTALKINCYSDTPQYITTLKLESNRSIKAIGDNQSVSYSFIPNRTDHMSTYTCVDSTHSSIMIEIKLNILYAPVVTGQHTNETVECDCDGNPAIYSVYRLDQISNHGELVRSVDLNNGRLEFQTQTYPYQRNGRYICVVSNGISDTNGDVLQTWSTSVKYKGIPVFSAENRYLKPGGVGLPLTLSFYIYSYPDVEEIFIEKTQLQKYTIKKNQTYRTFSTSLLYTEFGNIKGIAGYEILFETKVLSKDDCQVYRITAKNRLGESSYHFEIIDNDLLRFLNQTEHNTIFGQEGTRMEIHCSSFTVQYITALEIETNGSVIAIGDNQSVSFSFIPDRTDHLTKYKCVDSKHSSIMVEVKLIINYSPVVKGRYTNEQFKCDCDAVPSFYSVYQLNQLSKYGELVRSVNLNNEIFSYTSYLFPYQRNGRYTCVVSNGIPDIEGNVLQTWSTNVKYEGSPVFSPGNTNLRTGKIGHSVTLSFHIYSNPAIEDISIQRIGQKPIENKKIVPYNILNYTLLYSEFNNIDGIEGYMILIETDILDTNDFQNYRIIARNSLGESNFYFAIIDDENLPLSRSNKRYVVILCSIATVLFVYVVIVHVCICVKNIRTPGQRHQNVHDDHTYHTYDEIDPTSYRTISNINDNQGQNLPELLQAMDISTDSNLHSLDDYPAELVTEYPDDGLEQREITSVQGRSVSISSDDTSMSNTNVSSSAIQRIESILYFSNLNESTETPNGQHSQTSHDSDSETSNTVMVGNDGDGYENPYQVVLQDCPEYHPYIGIIRESISSTRHNTNEDQRLDNGSTKEPIYINLQF